MAFATTQDVADRMARTLSDAEDAAAELVIEVVTGLIATEAGQNAAWADELEPVPAYLRALCIEKATGVIANTENLANYSRTLGAYSESKTFPRSTDGGIVLTEAEGRMVRAAVYGSAIASPRVGSYLDDIYDCGS